MRIAILGFGKVGQKLARLFSNEGNQVFVGVRKAPEDTPGYPVSDFVGAVQNADAVALALPYQACTEVLGELAAELLEGKILIDCTNPVDAQWSPLLLGQENSAGEEIARLVPQAFIVKAFNTIFADAMERTEHSGAPITAFIAGDNEQAKQKVMGLASAIGYMPLDTGPLSSARYLEAMAHLNIRLAVEQGGGTGAAFIYSRG